MFPLLTLQKHLLPWVSGYVNHFLIGVVLTCSTQWFILEVKTSSAEGI